MPDDLHVVILAAGQASRFGSLKQLARLGGESLIRRGVACARAVAAAERIVVVTGCGHELMKREIAATGARVVENPHWRRGLGGSIRVGVAALPAAAAAVLLMACDQARVTGADLRRLVAARRAAPREQARRRIAAAAYADTVGIPAIFPADCFPQLRGLRGDGGAKTWLRRLWQKSDGSLIAVEMPAAEWDIDQKGDILEADLSEKTTLNEAE